MKKVRGRRHACETPNETNDVPLIGFGITFDIARGCARNWYQGADGVKRWADNDEPVDEMEGNSERAAVFE